MKVTYTDIAASKHDAGFYREFITEEFGSVLTYGGSSLSYNAAYKHCKRLAKIIGASVENIISQVVEDYKLMEE